jgi:predicted ATPase/DNA-binding CsgD family transcriptional regulator
LIRSTGVAATDQITEREVDILRLLVQGLSDREIGQQLSLALNTIKWYNKRIYRKLGVNNRTQAAARAEALGLLGDTAIDRGYPAPSGIGSKGPPAPVTAFVGRRREIGEVNARLEHARLLCITGPAGCGKTRLALQVAEEMAHTFPHGITFIPLESVGQADNLLWIIAEHLGMQFNPQRAPFDQLLRHLQDKRMLLVLDNFEHLIPAAQLLTDILRAAPEVKLLVTSRERLQVYGETVYVLGGLELPSSKGHRHAPDAESVQLFLQSAKAINPDLEVRLGDLQQVIRICDLVDGMPLALELAATWIDVLPLRDLVAELEDSIDILRAKELGFPHNQASMRAAINRSWEKLDAHHRAAFRRLSVFRGGFTREAAEGIARVSLHNLKRLAGKSFLRFDAARGRFQMHELLRHFGAEQLIASGEAAQFAEAHANYFAAFMEARWPLLKGRRQRIALRAIKADLQNVRTAWNFWVERRKASKIQKFLHGFWVMYDILGWYPSGIELFEAAASHMRDESSTEAKAVLGWMLAAQGFYQVAGGYNSRKGFSLAREGVEILEVLDQPQIMLVPLISLFITAVRVNDHQMISEAAEKCLRAAQQTGDAWGIAKAKQLRALKAIEDSDHELAAQVGREALKVFQELGDRWSESVLCIEVLGPLQISLHDFDQARDWIDRGLRAAQEIGFDYSIQMAYWQRGYIEALQGNYKQAGDHWQKALSIGDRVIGSKTMIGFGGSISSGEWGGRELIPGANAESQTQTGKGG